MRKNSDTQNIACHYSLAVATLADGSLLDVQLAALEIKVMGN